MDFSTKEKINRYKTCLKHAILEVEKYRHPYSLDITDETEQDAYLERTRIDGFSIYNKLMKRADKYAKLISDLRS
jgi:uncharacterized metal-binding protein